MNEQLEQISLILYAPRLTFRIHRRSLGHSGSLGSLFD